ncbi:MAG: right-handed parallel beta-helix repeat-containing protein [bacterium]|nr:right-handed parallel beta-helix repeat-containing protein [bacterium]
MEPQSADIILYNVTMDNNRRQGLSITDGKRMKILNSTFKNTNGHMPQAGIDIEPNPSRTITDIEIRNNTFENNASFGVVVSGGQFNRDTEEGRKYADTITRNILVLDNTFTNNTE